MSKIGDRIKSAREKNHISQVELATLIKVKSAGVISNWERNLSEPNSANMAALCRALAVAPTYLLDYYPETDTLAQNEHEHIKKYRSLGSVGQKAVDMILDYEVQRKSDCVKQSVLPDWI